MGWDMKQDGFGVVLSPQLPSLMQDNLGERGCCLSWKARAGDRRISTVSLFHPGGSKVLDTARDVLGLREDDLRHSWNVLRDFGNMSSATALFVLDEAMRNGAKGRHLMMAFGPGFSAYFAILDL